MYNNPPQEQEKHTTKESILKWGTLRIHKHGGVGQDWELEILLSTEYYKMSRY